ncbi:MAG: tyrosine recombinase [Leptospirales bacterium]|nr:tyrosine recombinase [Leptospirales bacterium]
MKEAAAIKEFKNSLQRKGLSQNSIYSYTYDLKKFNEFLSLKNKNILNATQEDIQQFLKHEKNDKKNSTRTLARSLAVIRQFYNFITDNIDTIKNPAEKVEMPHVDKSLPDFLTITELDKLFHSISEEDSYELRDKTIFELLYSSGLSISEAIGLHNRDVDFENMFVTVTGRGNKHRMVPIGEEAARLIKKYIKESRQAIIGNRESEFLFVSKKGSQLNRKSVWRFLKNYATRTEIKKNITPHTLRHSFATHLIALGADIRSVQELLGHMNISTTQVYTHMAKKQLQKINNIFNQKFNQGIR